MFRFTGVINNRFLTNQGPRIILVTLQKQIDHLPFL